MKKMSSEKSGLFLIDFFISKNILNQQKNNLNQ